MALTFDRFELTVTLIDSGANQSTKTFALNTSDYDDAILARDEILSALDAASDAKISGYRLSFVGVENAFSLPLGGVEIENQALLVFLLDGFANKAATFIIPAPNDGLFVSSTGKNRNVVDTSDAAIIAIRDLFTSSGVATISDGETVDIVQSGKRIHRRSSRG